MAPIELTVYRLEGYLVGWDRLEREDDRDVHVIIASPLNPRLRIITEIPDPACQSACSSGLAAYYGEARRVLLERLR